MEGFAHDLIQDLRHAYRGLARRPGFFALAAVTLAIGIGLSTAIFSVVNSVLLEPLAYRDAERLVQVVKVNSSNGDPSEYLTGLDFLDYREGVPAFDAIACMYAYRPTGFNLRTPGGTERVRSLQISSQFFKVYGVQPLLGRTFTPPEENTDAKLAIVSYDFWQRHFGGGANAIGQVLSLDGVGYEVVGVAPRGFADVHAGQVDLWVPHPTAPGDRNNRENHYITVVARLAPGAAVEQAQSQLDAVQARVVAESPNSGNESPKLIRLHDVVIGNSPRVLYALAAAAGLLLLIACFNLATMLLARASSRHQEFATRAALGSSRWRLARQLLTESLALATAGGGLGLLLAYAAIEWLVRIGPEGLPRASEVTFDARVFAAGAALTLLTAVLSGIFPAWRASRGDIEAALREGARGTSAARHRLHQILTTCQIAFAVVVLAFAALLTTSFQRLLAVELGFDDANVVTFDVNLPDADYPTGSDRERFFREFLGRVEAVPGVEAAASTSRLPATGRFNIWGYFLPGAEQFHPSDVRVVQGNYPGTLRVKLIAGRWFDDSDREKSQPVAVVSETLAARHWKPGERVGQTIRLAGAERRIIGVVADTRFEHREAQAPIAYLAHEQYASNRNWALKTAVRVGGPEVDALPAIRRELAALDPRLVLYNVEPLRVITQASVAREKLAMYLMGGFGLTALGLSLIGVYGVLAYLVTERTREIGIRMALGATPGRVLRTVFGVAARFALAGVAIGGILSLAGSNWLASLLYEVSPGDPVVLTAVGAIAIATALLACLGPAIRAMNVAPMEALRKE